MSYWLTDPQLFLHAKGTGPNDVHLWRCKKPVSTSSSSLVVPMKPDDFEYVETVTDYLELLANTIDWDETDFKRLVEYIFERRLLVNSQGFVIVELHKNDKDGNKMTDDANEKLLPAIYIRSLDVLALKPYIPKLRERPIPLRRVQVMEDEDGKAAVMEKDFNIVTKLTARVEHLEGKVTKLTADLATALNTLATLQRELNGVLENPNYKEVWMNDRTFDESYYTVKMLQHNCAHHDNITIIRPKGTFTSDDNSGTNVRATYWYIMKIDGIAIEYRAISLDDLTPNTGKARFAQGWGCIKSQGKIIVFRPN